MKLRWMKFKLWLRNTWAGKFIIRASITLDCTMILIGALLTLVLGSIIGTLKTFSLIRGVEYGAQCAMNVVGHYKDKADAENEEVVCRTKEAEARVVELKKETERLKQSNKRLEIVSRAIKECSPEQSRRFVTKLLEMAKVPDGPEKNELVIEALEILTHE